MGRVTQNLKTIQDPTIKRVVELAVEGSWAPQVHILAQRIIQDKNLEGSTPVEKLFYVCQKVLKYHPDPITSEMIIWPAEMARQLWDYLYEGGKVQPMGDCDCKAAIMMALCYNRRFTVRAVGAWQSMYSPNFKTINHVYPDLKVDSQVAGMVRRNPSAKVMSDGWLPMETSSVTLKFGEQRAEVKPISHYYAKVDGVEIK